jgi:hypothetical protein
MTMHLASHAYSSVRNRKYNPKYTKANIAKWTEECRVYNKDLKRMGQPKMSLEQYIDYVHGKGKVPNPARDRAAFKPYTAPEIPAYRRNDTSHIPSNDSCAGVATKKEPMMYTGDLIAGIATMHKSNAVPVLKGTDEAKDIARMRR